MLETILNGSLTSPILKEGVDTFYEIGPGKTLINMIKKIDPQVRIFSVSELDALLSEINNA